MLPKRPRNAISRENRTNYSSNTLSNRFSNSQTTKSIRVKQPQYHPSPGHSASQSLRIGTILLLQQKLSDFFSQGESEGREETMRPRTAPLRSCLLLMLSIFTRSARVRPQRSVLPALSTTQLIMAAGPVTTKLSSLRNGRSRTTHSAASVSLNLFHWSGVKKRSTQGTCRYSQSKRHICALPRNGQQPMVTGRPPSSTQRTQGRIVQDLKSLQFYFFPVRPSPLPPSPSLTPLPHRTVLSPSIISGGEALKWS